VSSSNDCGVVSMIVVHQASITAEESTSLNPVGLEFVRPVDVTLETDYSFAVVLTADGGSKFLSPFFTLTIGCTPSMIITDSAEFTLTTHLYADESMTSIYTITTPTSDRTFCPPLSH
jgi:hypothetical protein